MRDLATEAGRGECPLRGVTLDLNGVPAANIKGIANFMAFSAQAQNHLNANGLCYVNGQNASDPFYVPNVTP